MFKQIIILVIAFVIVLASAVQAKTAQDFQSDIGVDKIAHAAAGAVCSLYLSERLLEHRKHRKLVSAAACSFLAFQKEKTDTKSDPKDFLATEIGVIVSLIEWKIKF